MITRSRRFIRLGMLAISAMALAEAAQAVDLRDWGRKYPASERFVVLAQFNNQAVLDKETQLVWQRTPSAAPALHWEQAKALCAGGILAGRRGWRLPSMHELSSLADPSKPFGELALPTGHPFNAVANTYWTVTRHLAGSGQPTGYAYYVDFSGGGATSYGVTVSSSFYWCVRGGGPISEY